MSLLCKLGIHRWGGIKKHMIWNSHVWDFEKTCKRCGKVKKWNKIRQAYPD